VPEASHNVFFFPNGNTSVTRNGVQVPELQQPWLTMYVEWLERQGCDPTAFTFRLPNGMIATPIRGENCWNWDIQTPRMEAGHV
jgi:hypothetical protein